MNPGDFLDREREAPRGVVPRVRAGAGDNGPGGEQDHGGPGEGERQGTDPGLHQALQRPVASPARTYSRNATKIIAVESM